jgi:hypothetical protein
MITEHQIDTEANYERNGELKAQEIYLDGVLSDKDR